MKISQQHVTAVILIQVANENATNRSRFLKKNMAKRYHKSETLSFLSRVSDGDIRLYASWIPVCF